MHIEPYGPTPRHVETFSYLPPMTPERLRQQNIAVLFVTANPRMLEGAQAAAIGVLTKPCDEDLILAAVDYALGQRQGVPLPAPPGLKLLNAA